MAKKATLTTCSGGHLGDDPQDREQMAPLLPAGQEQEEAEDITDNKDEEEDTGALLTPGIVERG